MKSMTFEEVLDGIAKEHNFKTWNEATRIDHDFLFDHYEEAAELYGNSLAAKAWGDACYAQIDMIIDNELYAHPWSLKQNIKNSSRPKNPYNK